MSSFTEKLELIPLSCEGIWKTGRGFSYYPKEKGIDEIVIPKGYHTDGASVPKILQKYFPKDGPYVQAAVLHDWFHHHMGMAGGKIYSRKQCDILFYEAMTVIGISFFIRNIIYYGVRFYSIMQGDVFFKNYFEEKVLVGCSNEEKVYSVVANSGPWKDVMVTDDSKTYIKKWEDIFPILC